MGSFAGRDIRQTFDYPKVPGLALGDAAVTSHVECLHSHFLAKNCAVGAQQGGLLPCSPSERSRTTNVFGWPETRL
jgi:hypothetical protein